MGIDSLRPLLWILVLRGLCWNGQAHRRYQYAQAKAHARGVDKNTGWDLLNSQHVARLKLDIKIKRPLHTHLAPTCRIFSQAYTTPPIDDPEWADVMRLAHVVADLVLYIVSLQLFCSVETPVGSWLYTLGVYIRIARIPGFYFVVADMCMFGNVHPATGKLVRKGLKLRDQRALDEGIERTLHPSAL